MHPRPLKGRDMTPVMLRLCNDCLRRATPALAEGFGRTARTMAALFSSEGDLDFVLPSAMKGLR